GLAAQVDIGKLCGLVIGSGRLSILTTHRQLLPNLPGIVSLFTVGNRPGAPLRTFPGQEWVAPTI
ncbi:MAG: hypothetical protein J4F46_08360, partial [Dehalococcoidia bacterium]|nr:hypothetical protein [Dehalococcoidia bacterium]